MKKFLPLIFLLIMITIAINRNKEEKIKIKPYKIEIKNEKQKKCKLEILPEIDLNIYRTSKSEHLISNIFDENRKHNKESVYSDTELLFKLLSTHYVGYCNNGGKNTFNKIKENIFNKLEKEIFPITQKKYDEILINEFSKYIKDGHFNINNKNLKHIEKFTYLSKDYIKKDDILEVNADIVPTIDLSGKIQYILKTENSKYLNYYEINAKHKDNTEEKISLYPLLNHNISIFDYTDNENIVYIAIPRFYDNKKIIYEKVKNTNFKNKDVIIDLRGNHGGYLENIESLLREIFDFKFDMDLDNQDIFLNFNDIKASNRFNTKIYILVNKESASASELTVLFTKLFDFKNTYVIGDYTSGAFQYSSGDKFYLPNTKTSFIFSNYTSHPILENINEYEGFKPDIWLDTHDKNFLIKVRNFVKNNR